jgi:hypothetical protein
MRRVPRQFKLLGHTITVRVVSKRDWESLADECDDMEEDDMGYWMPDQNLIVLKRLPRSQLLHTLYHELTHAILYYMGDPLWRDEDFVDQFGGLLAQAIDTAR